MLVFRKNSPYFRSYEYFSKSSPHKQVVLCQVESIEVDQLKTSKYKNNPIRSLIIVLTVIGGDEKTTLNIGYAPLKDCEEFLGTGFSVY